MEAPVQTKAGQPQAQQPQPQPQPQPVPQAPPQPPDQDMEGKDQLGSDTNQLRILLGQSQTAQSPALTSSSPSVSTESSPLMCMSRDSVLTTSLAIVLCVVILLLLAACVYMARRGISASSFNRLSRSTQGASPRSRTSETGRSGFIGSQSLPSWWADMVNKVSYTHIDTLILSDDDDLESIGMSSSRITLREQQQQQLLQQQEHQQQQDQQQPQKLEHPLQQLEEPKQTRQELSVTDETTMSGTCPEPAADPAPESEMADPVPAVGGGLNPATPCTVDSSATTQQNDSS